MTWPDGEAGTSGPRERELEAEIARLRGLLIQAGIGADARCEPALGADERFRRALTIDTVGVIVFDIDGAITQANAAALRMSGFTPDDVAAGRLRLPELTTPEWASQSHRAIEDLKANGRAAPYEKECLRKDGTRWWALFAAEQAGEHGGIGYVIDITERKLGEEALRASQQRFRLLLEALEQLPAATTRDEVLRLLHATARRLSGADGVAIALRDGDQCYYVAEDGPAAHWAGQRFPLASCVSGWTMLHGQTAVIPDVSADPRLPQEVYKAASVKSFVMVPVGQGETAAAIGAYWSHHHAPEQEEIETLEALARASGAALRNIELLASLQDSEDHYRHAIDLNPQMAWRASADGRLDYVPQRWHDWTGITDPIETWREAFHPEDLPRVAERWAHALQSGEPLDVEHRVRMRDGAYCWMRSRAYPRRDAHGRVVRWYGTTEDIHERKLAEERLRASEAHLSAILAQAAVGLSEICLDGRFRNVNDELCRILGRPREDLLSLSIADVTQPEDMAHSLSAIERVIAAGEPASFEKRYVRPDGGQVWASSTLTRLDDEHGRPQAVLAATVDLSERKAMEEHLRRSRRRFRTLIEGMPQLVWRSREGGEWTWASPQWTDYTGQDALESQGLQWLRCVHPDDREQTMAAWHEAGLTGRLSVEHRLRRASDGEYRWFQTRAMPDRDEAGQVVEWLGTSTDVDDLRRLQDEQKTLVAELQHRTRNLLAVVRSIAIKTIDTSPSLEAFWTQFNHRLAALTRVQGLLSRSDERPVTIGNLVRMELDALGANVTPGRVVVDGPDVVLRNSTVQTLALALHELATNALKYGALSTEQGHLSVTWRLRQAESGKIPHLAVDWVEHAGRGRANRPGRAGRGYGRELIERALPYQLGAKTSFELGQDGVRCSIDLPLRRRRPEELG